MKNSLPSRLLAFVLFAVLLPCAPAHPPGRDFDALPPEPAAPAPKEDTHAHITKIPQTVGEIWRAIAVQQQRLDEVVADKNLAAAHDPAFAIRDLAKALADKVTDAQKTAAASAAEKIAAHAADIDRSAAAGAQKTTESNVQALGRALTTFKTLVSHDG